MVVVRIRKIKESREEESYGSERRKTTTTTIATELITALLQARPKLF